MDRTTFYRLLATYLDAGDLQRDEAGKIVDIWESNHADDPKFDFWSALSARDAMAWDSPG